MDKQIIDLRRRLQDTRLQVKAGKITNTNAHKKLKKELAQLLTSANSRLASGQKNQQKS